MGSFESLLRALHTGGPVMYALAALSYLLYWQIIALLFYTLKVRLVDFVDRKRVVEELASWERESASEPSRTELMLIRYDEILWQFRDFIKNRLRFADALLVAAPLLGLLGTVLGMLEMFDGLALRAGHQTTLLVAEGVKQSLITTQTGLTIAIPALFFVYWIRRVAHRREVELLERKVEAAEG